MAETKQRSHFVHARKIIEKWPKWKRDINFLAPNYRSRLQTAEEKIDTLLRELDAVKAQATEISKQLDDMKAEVITAIAQAEGEIK